MTDNELKELFDKKYLQYNNPQFIESDPILIPHSFSEKNDIEISAFLTSVISWGKREQIIKNAKKMMTIMDNKPYEFIMNYDPKFADKIPNFVHRTFQHQDFLYYLAALKNICQNHGGLQNVFENSFSQHQNIKETLIDFREIFFQCNYPLRTGKHIADVKKGAAAKRLNMFLMWLCRKDNNGVHFGIWNIPTSALMLPLDVHTAHIGRKFGIITRNQNDWRTVEQITEKLRQFDANDPVKYDFALFGLGIFDKI